MTTSLLAVLSLFSIALLSGHRGQKKKKKKTSLDKCFVLTGVSDEFARSLTGLENFISAQAVTAVIDDMISSPPDEITRWFLRCRARRAGEDECPCCLLRNRETFLFQCLAQSAHFVHVRSFRRLRTY